jgi:hypothetical protein
MRSRLSSIAVYLRRTSILGRLQSELLIPLAVLSLYLVAASLLLPAGVNRVFVTRSAQALLPVAGLLWIAFLILAWLTLGALPRPRQPTAGPRLGDGILVLLPLTPVLQYVLLNAAILFPVDVFLVVGTFALLASLLILGVPFLLRRSGAARSLIYMGLAFAFSLANMAALSRQFRWHDWVSLKILLPVFGGIWLIGWLLDRLNQRSVMTLAILAFLGANTVVQMATRPQDEPAEEPSQSRNALAALVGSRQPRVTPSIYLLVYDAYVGSETMAAHGIDNRDQERYLQDLGFKIYPEAYSLAAGSLKTMSRVLNASPAYVLDRDGRKAVAGAGVVQRLLGEYGYATYGVFPSDFFFRGTAPTYDVSFPRPRSSAALLLRAILEGEFRFDVGFDDVPRGEYRAEKEQIFAAPSSEPKFVYTHSSLPGHAQMSGVCRPNEEELYGEDVAKANAEMRVDVETILEADPGAIVIVAGDHGPRLTKNCMGTGSDYPLSEISRLDIQDRFGTFLAIRWPEEGFEEYDDITVLQDLFPAIFAYLFADAALLEARPEPITLDASPISGARVEDGVIVGGIDSGEPLFTGADSE